MILKNVFNTGIAAFIAINILSCSNVSDQDNQEEQDTSEEVIITVQNALDTVRQDVLVYLPEDKVNNLNLQNKENLVLVRDGKETPTQYVRKGSYTGLIAVLDKLEANANVEYELVQVDSAMDFPKRTQAELSIKEGGEWKGREYIGGSFKNVDSLRVPDEHTDHTWYIRYEGPGWESDKVGYRFYLDWRNATDAFGKRTNEMVLQNVGQDGFDSYHELHDWGMDIQKVGSSLGVGSPAIFHGGRAVRIDSTDSVISKVLINGDLFSAIQTNYYGWKVADQKFNVESVISIHAGTRLSHMHLNISGNPDNASTGIGKDKSAQLFSSEGNENGWGYLATYGKQSLNNDNVGYVVFFPSDRFMEFTEDEHSHVVKLSPDGGNVEYYFAAAWELEKDGIKSESEFLQWVKRTAGELANPVTASIKNNK